LPKRNILFSVVKASSIETLNSEMRFAIFTKLAETNYNRASDDGAKAIIGFVSRNPYPASYSMFVRKLEWNRIANLKYYSKRK
nr:hypothetical protein [Ignavibacteriaceae bacterium]